MRLKLLVGDVDACSSLAFHPVRSWVLIGYRSGDISVWDYEAGIQLYKARAHLGPIRAVDYHHQLHLYVTGGDDCRVKVWSYDKKKCVVVFRGHEDYVRQTAFHSKYSWVISCSDDCTIRFWNWMSKEHLTTVSGHMHWIYSFDLHPEQDLMASVSVDNTMRLWDYSSLRNRVSNRGQHAAISHLFGTVDVVTQDIMDGFYKETRVVKFHPTMPFVLATDGSVVRIFSLEWRTEIKTLVGHFGAVTGLQFFSDTTRGDPRLVLASSSMDGTIKTWDLKTGLCLQTYEWPADQAELARDKRIPLPISLFIGHQKYTSVVKHRSKLLFGSVTQKGLACVWRFQKERPVHTVYKHHLYFMSNGFLIYLNMEKMSEKALAKIPGGENQSLSYNPTEHAIIRNYAVKHTVRSPFVIKLPEEFVYQLFFLIDSGTQKLTPRFKASAGEWATWISGQRFCCLQPDPAANVFLNQMVAVKDLNNQNVAGFGGLASGFLLSAQERVQRMDSSASSLRCDRIFPSPLAGHALLYESDTARLVHYNLNKRRRVGAFTLKSSRQAVLIYLKSCVWNQVGNMLAVSYQTFRIQSDGASKSCSSTIAILDSNLRLLRPPTVVVSYRHKLARRRQVKSMAWCEVTGALLYTTCDQLRYLVLPTPLQSSASNSPSQNGSSASASSLTLSDFNVEEGCIMTLPVNNTYYLVRVDTKGRRVICLTRSNDPTKRWTALPINPTEYAFRSAVMRGDEDEVRQLVASGQLVGQSQLAFLERVDRVDIALNFVHDPQDLLALALRLNRLDVAVTAAQDLASQKSAKNPANSSQMPSEEDALTGCWADIGAKAMMNGELNLAETCYRSGRLWDKLSFIYIITGQLGKLDKLTRMLTTRGLCSHSKQYELALLLGDRDKQAQLLELADQEKLAHVIRSTDSIFTPNMPARKDVSDWPRMDQSQASTKGVSQREAAAETYRDQLKSALS